MPQHCLSLSSHLSCDMLIGLRETARRETGTPPLPPPPSCVPPRAPDLREKREEVTANTESRQPYLKPSCVRSSQERGGDRRHMEKGTKGTRGCIQSVHTNTHTKHRSLIFPSNHCASATEASTANFPHLLVCVCRSTCVCV